MAGSNRCRMHGGKTPRGKDLPQTKHARYSEDLPDRLAERFEEAVADQELYDLHTETALLQARISDLLKRVDSGESGHLWRQLGQVWSLYMEALTIGDEDEIVLKRRQIGDLIERGGADYKAWEELAKTVEQKRKLAELDRKRQVDLHLTIPVQRLTALVLMLNDSIRANAVRHVSDDNERRRFLAATSTDIRGVLSVGAGDEAGS